MEINWKPFKRFPFWGPVVTGLKPGVNEKAALPSS